jgi:hypothetical protein
LKEEINYSINIIRLIIVSGMGDQHQQQMAMARE